MSNRWFILKNVGDFNGNKFSFFTSTDDSYVKYDILEMKFKIGCRLQWFSYSWRRREGEDISYLYAQPQINVDIDEIFKIPLFQTIEEQTTIKKAKIIEQIIKDVDIKQSMIEKYAKQLGSGIYDRSSKINIGILHERYCSYNDVGVKRLFGEENDDFSEVADIKECIIDAYK